MRIVAGTARGRRIKGIEGIDVRPTMDRVREAVFNSLTSHDMVAGRTFVDLFAGSGALGLEALSRGAESVLFVDNSRTATETISENLDALGLGEGATVRTGDGAQLVATLPPFDVALLDPPYEFDGWNSLLDAVPAQVVAIESNRSIELGDRWQILKEKRYASTVVRIARRTDMGSTPRRG